MVADGAEMTVRTVADADDDVRLDAARGVAAGAAGPATFWAAGVSGAAAVCGTAGWGKR